MFTLWSVGTVKSTWLQILFFIFLLINTRPGPLVEMN